LTIQEAVEEMPSPDDDAMSPKDDTGFSYLVMPEDAVSSQNGAFWASE